MNTNRKYVYFTLFVFIGLLFAFKIFSLQINTGYRERAENNALNKITIYPSRSIIYDRNNRLIAYNASIYDLIVFPKEVNHIDSAKLCNLLGISLEEYNKRLKTAKTNSKKRKKNNAFNSSAVFYSNLNTTQYSSIQENLYQFPGFYIEPKTDRLYAVKGAAHLLGFLGEVSEKMMNKDPNYYKPGDLVGITGIEEAYEKLIRGEKGVKTMWQDRRYKQRGEVKSELYNYPAIAGPDFYSTIDLELQMYADIMLNNKRGSVVAIEPATGEILALVNKPDYDPNLLVGESRSSTFAKLLKDPKKPLYNRALRGTYPPGSTFKPVIALIGLQEGVLTPGTMHGCYGGYHLGSLTVGCHPHPSPLALANALGISCNAYFCQVFRDIVDNPKAGSAREGYIRLEKHLRSFGLGSPLGIDLPGESAGNVPSTAMLDKRHGKNWKSGMIISLGIGQGEILLTPVQLANMCATIANRGYYYIPHTLKRWGNGMKTDSKYTQKHQTTVEPKYFEFVIDGMELVTRPGGTAFGTGIPDIEICSKTGTAQNPHGNHHSLYIAFAPRVNPKIAIAVIVENAGYGADWAAPIANLMIEKYLRPKENSKAPALFEKMKNGVLF